MGRGPGYLLENGLEEALGANRCSVHPVESGSALPVEVAVAFELDRLVAGEVGSAVAAGEFPLVLSGNCNTSVGTMSGVGPGQLGVIWFDAHADFNTPDTTTTGFSDNMGLSIALGHCWGAMARSVPGFEPVPDENVVLMDARGDIEPAEQERLDASSVVFVRPDTDEDTGMLAALDTLRTKVERVYVHLDVDVLDPEKVAPANEFAVPGGLSPHELEAAIQRILARFTVAAAGIASYDPSFDEEGAILHTALACAGMLATPRPASR